MPQPVNFLEQWLRALRLVELSSADADEIALDFEGEAPLGDTLFGAIERVQFEDYDWEVEFNPLPGYVARSGRSSATYRIVSGEVPVPGPDTTWDNPKNVTVWYRAGGVVHSYVFP